MIPVVSRSLVRWRRSVGKDDGKLHVFPDEVPAKQFVFLRRWKRRREMVTRIASLLRF